MAANLAPSFLLESIPLLLMLWKKQKSPTSLDQFCISQDDSLLQAASIPKQQFFSHQLPTLSGQSHVHKRFSLSLLCLPMWEGWGGKKMEKKKKKKSGQCHLCGDISILSVRSHNWQNKSFILLYQCKPKGQRAHRLSPGGLADPDYWSVPQEWVSLTPWSYSPPSALLQSSQPWMDLQKSSWRGYFPHHCRSEQQRF